MKLSELVLLIVFVGILVAGGILLPFLLYLSSYFVHWFLLYSKLVTYCFDNYHKL